MRKLITLVALVALAIPTTIHAQDDRAEQMEKRRQQDMERHKRMEAQKIAYLTAQMELTPEESKRFWPVYNEYQAEIEKIEKDRRGKMGLDSFDGERKVSPEELERQMRAKFESERNRVAIDEKYFDRFQEVLPPEKLLKFYQADVQFKRELLRELGRERQGMTDEERREHREKMKERRRPAPQRMNERPER